MEEIWKDIPNLTSVQNSSNSFDAMNLQEFLARPFLYPNYNINPVFPATTAAPTNLFSSGHATNNAVSLRPQGNSLSTHQHGISNMTTCSQQPGLGLSMSMGMQSSGNARKRIVNPYENIDQNNSRHQRLIKNRESAARSRIRKEARTAQLEAELETLKAENAMLKKAQELSMTDQASKNRTLNRSLSSPF